MEWTVAFDGPAGTAVITTSGCFDVKDHASMVADIVTRKEWHPGHPVLFDHRGLDFGDAGYQQMIGARNTHVAHEEQIGPARTAILMKSTSDFGSARQFQILVEGLASAEMAVFLDEQAAWEWLGVDDPLK